MDALDKENGLHKFGSSDAEIREDGVCIKRLDFMNRDIRKIILIDDSQESSSMFPRNTLLIKPFENVYDKQDKALLELIPLLQGLIHEDIQDYREVFDRLDNNRPIHYSHDVATEYKMRVVQAKTSEYQKRHRGIGAWIHGDAKSRANKEAEAAEDQYDGILTPAQVCVYVCIFTNDLLYLFYPFIFSILCHSLVH